MSSNNSCSKSHKGFSVSLLSITVDTGYCKFVRSWTIWVLLNFKLRNSFQTNFGAMRTFIDSFLTKMTFSTQYNAENLNTKKSLIEMSFSQALECPSFETTVSIMKICIHSYYFISPQKKLSLLLTHQSRRNHSWLSSSRPNRFKNFPNKLRHAILLV